MTVCPWTTTSVEMHQVTWHLEWRSDIPVRDNLQIEDVRDDHLRAANGDLENFYIARLMSVSLRMAERITRRAIVHRQFDLVMDRFPTTDIRVPRPPLQTVESITYIDTAGVEQTLDEASYQVSIPRGPNAGCARIRPAYGLSWPSVRSQMDAVTVTYTAGYLDDGSPQVPNVPEDIDHARLLVMGELYKQRSESVHAFNQNPSIIRARDIFSGYRVYGET